MNDTSDVKGKQTFSPFWRYQGFRVFLVCFALLGISNVLLAQGNDSATPKKVLLKSVVLPGWGHLSLEDSHHARGKWHLGSEVALWLGYAGFTARAHHLEQKLVTQAATYADIDIENRSEQLWLALGQYESLDVYNEQQLQNRNWDQLYDDVPNNRWRWESSTARRNFESTRDLWNRTKQQLPALLSAMILNRVIAGVSAFRRARDIAEEESTAIHSRGDEANSKQMAFRVSFKPNPHINISSRLSAFSIQPVIQISF